MSERLDDDPFAELERLGPLQGEEIQVWEDEPPYPQRRRETPALRQRPKLASTNIWHWFESPAPPIRFSIEHIVPKGMVTLMSGDGGAGKTLLSQQMITCTAAGVPFLGLQVEPGAAVGIFGEDPEEVLHGRQRRICEAMGIEPDEQLIDRLRPASYLGSDVALWRSGKPTDFFAELEEDLSRVPGLSLAVIDSASLVFAGNENDRGEVATFMGALNGLAHRLKAGVVLLGHTSKSQTDEASGMASGSTSWVWQARSALRLKTSKETGSPVLSHPKANHAKKIEPVDLVWSENGVLMPRGVVQLKLPHKDVLRAILAGIRAAWDSGKPWSPHPQSKRTGTYAVERICRDFGLEARTAGYLVTEWLNNDVLSVDVYDERDRKSGLKVIGGID